MAKRSKSSSKRSRRRVSKSRRRCNIMLSRKVRKYVDEYKSGKAFYSAKQPIAVAYSEIKKIHPECSRYYTRPEDRKVKKSRKRSSRR
jgi:hypothetical protein